jgi:hypothetical protein
MPMTDAELLGLKSQVEACLREFPQFDIRNVADLDNLLKSANDSDSLFDGLLWKLKPTGATSEEEYAVEEYAVAVLLALLTPVDAWPPSRARAFCRRVAALLKKEFPHNRPHSRALRAPEFVIAYLLGWKQTMIIKWNSPRWHSIVKKATNVIYRDMFISVESCLNWMGGTEDGKRRENGQPWGARVIGFPHGEDPGPWTRKLLNLFLGDRRRCDCWKRVARGIEDRQGLRGNAKSKAATCMRQHNIRYWNPDEPLRKDEPDGEKWTLWRFSQRAIKGFIGKFRAAQFPTGMLFDHLLEKFLLRLVQVAKRRCALCGNWTVLEFCRHHQPSYPLEPQDTFMRAQRSQLIMDDERGGFREAKVWTCSKDGHIIAGGVIIEGHHIYLAQKCRDGCLANGEHDCCPLCRTEHPSGQHRRLSTVHFFDPFAWSSQHAHVPQWLRDTMLVILREFRKYGWLYKNADIQDEDTQDWQALYEEMRTRCLKEECPAFPTNLSEFKSSILKEVKPHLSPGLYLWLIAQESGEVQGDEQDNANE